MEAVTAIRADLDGYPPLDSGEMNQESFTVLEERLHGLSRVADIRDTVSEIKAAPDTNHYCFSASERQSLPAIHYQLTQISSSARNMMDE